MTDLAGLDVEAVLAEARRAAGAIGSYGPGDPPPDAGVIVPLTSAGQELGGLVLDGAADAAALERARAVAALAAQAIQAYRSWESHGKATLDALTGLPNRQGFAGVLVRELARARRTAANVAVCVIDVDGLGGHNLEGTARGDQVLRLAAGTLSRGVRSYDCVCRIGGDEFALVLPGMSAESAATLVSRLAADVAAQGTGGRAVSVSGGVASFPHHGGEPEELVRLSMAALAQAQEAGGGRIVAHAGAAHPVAERAAEAAAPAAAAGLGRSAVAGLLAGEMGLDADRAERVRLAAFAYELDDDQRLAARVAAGALDGEAAEWILARHRAPGERPLETRILETADAFARAGGHGSPAGSGRALAAVWQEGSGADPDCVRALERLLDRSSV